VGWVDEGKLGWWKVKKTMRGGDLSHEVRCDVMWCGVVWCRSVKGHVGEVVWWMRCGCEVVEAVDVWV
jgi:hypothetical protein